MAASIATAPVFTWTLPMTILLKNTFYVLSLALLIMLTTGFTPLANRPAYKLYTAKGKSVSYNRMLQALQEADVILFGEQHNNPINHWLQYEVARDLYRTKGPMLVLGAEMFETDNQDALNKYLSNQIDYKQLEQSARLWPNFKTDYKPLADLAREKQIPFIATNIPRRYASMVARGGLDTLATLPADDQQWIAPLPIQVDLTLPGYKAFTEMNMGHPGITSENMARAQAVKDATMAKSIVKHHTPGKLFLHFNGTYHSNNYEGIYWYLKQLNPSLKIVTIASVEAEAPDLALPRQERGLADFILITPATMTKTY
jgi:uncharacterized iron-regulated protein